MQQTKKASSVIIIIVLLTMWLILWTIIIQKKFSIDNILKNFEIKSKLSQNISDDSLLLNTHLKNNTWNWSFKDMIYCPNEVKYMSGIFLEGSSSTIKYFDNNNYYCSWNINGNSLKIYFNDDFNNFTWWVLWSSWFTLTYNNPWYSWSIDSKSIEFSYNLNNISLYNDSLWRKEIIWKAYKTDYKSIFYINDEIRDFIDNNTNNTSSYTKNISQVSSGSLFLDITLSGGLSWTWIIKIVEFEKSSTNELIKKEVILENELLYWSWNIKKNWSDLYLDFTSWDFWVFLKSKDDEYVYYKFRIYDNSWSWVFIIPIKDDTENIEYLNSNIIIEKNNYIKETYLIK